MKVQARKATVAVAAAGVALALAATGCASKEERARDDAGSGAGWQAGVPSIKIGLIAPMTGPFAVLGISQQNSMKIMIDKINSTGGLGGAKLDLVTRDSGLDPGKAVRAATEFAGDQQVGLIVGPSLTAFYDAAKGTYEQSKKVNCQPAVATGDFSGLTYGFLSQDPLPLDIQKILKYLKSKCVKSVGLIYENDDTGKNTDAALKRQAAKYGIRYLGFEGTRDDDQSHKPYVEKFKDADAIMLSSSVGGAKTMAAANQIGYRGILSGTGSGMQNISFVESAGKIADGAVFPAAYYPYPTRQDRSDWEPGYRKHTKEIESRFGKNTGPKTDAMSPKGAAITADCTFAYQKAANAAKSIDADKVAAALEKLDAPADQTPSGNSIKPGSNHEFYGPSDIHVYQWKSDSKGWFTKDVTPKS